MLSLKLATKAIQRWEGGQIWFWPSDLEEPEKLPSEAAPLLLLEPRGKIAASALYDPASVVPIRVYAKRKQVWGEAFALEQWRKALRWRDLCVGKDSTGYRMVHSEADGMPGLIADCFGTHLSLSVSQRSWAEYLPAMLAALRQEGRRIEGVSLEMGDEVSIIEGSLPELVSYKMNGLSFYARPRGGQKTGAFLDQRENYVALQGWLRRFGLTKFGLDLYCSNGGFSRHMSGILHHVEAVDSSQLALDCLQRGMEADLALGLEVNVQAIRADVRDYMLGKAAARRSYDAVVVDPPAFAKSKRQKEEALRQYFDINQRALRLTRPGGVFVSCSCSHHVSGEDFMEVLQAAARANEKTLQLLERRGQGLDHPVILGIAETEYLKCFFFRVI